ncbi:hypothetical protein DFS34DRAFT_98148 [Phlyctochytrium arcticum]|nr:hypothetical protein DFS34DRAFT_98148 [Phlyctochytrium arcticum]
MSESTATRAVPSRSPQRAIVSRGKPISDSPDVASVADVIERALEKHKIDLSDTTTRSLEEIKQLYKIICKVEPLSAPGCRGPRLVSREDFSQEAILRCTRDHLSLAQLYAEIIIFDHQLAQKYDLEARLWRSALYPGIVTLRANLQACAGRLEEPVDSAWVEFVESAEDLYERVLLGMQARQDNALLDIVQSQGTPPKNWYYHNGAVTWHRTLNYMGDLSRYQNLHLCDIKENRDWSMVQKLYKEASIISPFNGLYCNQLAITAMYEDRHLDGLHYYLRSLTGDHPFVGAKDSVTFLFNLNRKQLEQSGFVTPRRGGARNAAASKSKTTKEASKDASAVGTSVKLFIRLQEMNVTRISLERYPAVFADFVTQFAQAAPSLREATDANLWTWLQLASVNMSVLTLASEIAKENANTNLIIEQTYGIAFHLLDMAIKEQMAAMHQAYDGQNEDDVTGPNFDEDKPTTTAGILYIGVVLSWFAATHETASKYITVSKYARIWSSLANLCNGLARLLAEHDKVLLSGLRKALPSVPHLPEEWELRGSQGMKNYNSKRPLEYLLDDCIAVGGENYSVVHGSAKVKQFMEHHLAEDGRVRMTQSDSRIKSLRVRKVLESVIALGDKIPLVDYDVEKKSFVYQKWGTAEPKPAADNVSAALEKLTLDETVAEAKADTPPLPLPGASNEEEEMEFQPWALESTRRSPADVNSSYDSASGSGSTDDDIDETDSAVQELKDLRSKLHGTITSQERAARPHTHKSGTRPSKSHSEARITPGLTTIVFDTNICLHRLADLEKIVASGLYTINIPLVVITELDGLKVGDDLKGRQAQAAIQYFEGEFGDGVSKNTNQTLKKRKPWLKLITSRGNILPDLRVRTENWSTYEKTGPNSESDKRDGRRRNNDDVIISCCAFNTNPKAVVALADANGVPSSGHSVVLVTEDVNMKLKARARGIPVLDKLSRVMASLAQVQSPKKGPKS